MSKPQVIEDSYYGKRYSAPVVGILDGGKVYPYFVKWDYQSNGWVHQGLTNGPCASDYQYIPIVKWLPIDEVSMAITTKGIML